MHFYIIAHLWWIILNSNKNVIQIINITITSLVRHFVPLQDTSAGQSGCFTLLGFVFHACIFNCFAPSGFALCTRILCRFAPSSFALASCLLRSRSTFTPLWPNMCFAKRNLNYPMSLPGSQTKFHAAWSSTVGARGMHTCTRTDRPSVSPSFEWRSTTLLTLMCLCRVSCRIVQNCGC